MRRKFSATALRHRPLIAVVAAIAVITATATLISVRLDASPRPSGAPPLDIPSPSASQLPRVASAAWPTTRPESVPARCKQVSLKGAAGASVVSYLDDNRSQKDLVAKEARGLRLIDISWTSLASPTDLAQTDSLDLPLPSRNYAYQRRPDSEQPMARTEHRASLEPRSLLIIVPDHRDI